jgi:oxygen-dependent protoporphyrinogen oxidase
VAERIIVVGAGIAGLTAAFRLSRLGYDVTVLEGDSRVGGRMSSAQRDGYRFDRGAVSLSTKYEHMHKLIAEVGIGDQVVPCPDTIGIPRDGTIHRIRSKAPVRSATTGLLSTRSKLAALPLGLDLRRLGKVIDWDDIGACDGWDDETAKDWVLRRVGGRSGTEIEQHVTDAVVRGGLMTRTDTMSALELQFLLVSFFGAELFTFDHGVGVLPSAMAAKLDVRLNTRVMQVEEHTGGVRVSSVRDGEDEVTEDADACVIALSGHDMAAVHPGLPAEHRAIMRGTDYVALIRISLALDRRPAETSMFLALSERAHPDLCGLFPDHNRHPSRAPEGKGMVTAYWHHDWNTAEWDNEDDVIVDKTIAAASEFIPELENSVRFADLTRWRASFLYARPGTYKALHHIAAAREHAKRIHLAGDYFGGPSTNTSLSSGELAASRLAAYLGGGARARTEAPDA